MADADLAARLREAREYLGLSREQAAEKLHCAPLLIEAMEAGTAEPFDGMLARFARLYRRPAGWFRGESTFMPSPELLRKTENLTPGDREAILDFAEFLQGAGPAPRATEREKSPRE